MTRKLKPEQAQAPQGKKPSGFFKKPPTNLEMILELQRHVGQIYRVLEELNVRLTAMSIAKVAPEVLAKFILDIEAIQQYNESLNTALDKEIEAKNQAEEKTIKKTQKDVV